LLARYRGVSFHEERLSWLRDEAAALFEHHYREASADLSVPLAMNWEMYERLEQAGLEACVIMRKDGAPIGYAVYVMAPHMHYQTIVADADLFFIEPAHRSGWLGVKIFRVAEDLLREKGVNDMCNRVKLHVQPGRGGRDLGVMFRFMGYKPIETIYKKRIG
jgi:GNAT superfamily N-acetyltransferase